MHHPRTLSTTLAAAAILLLHAGCRQPAPARELAAWTFTTPEAVTQWSSNTDIQRDADGTGVLAGHVVGRDPILIGPPMTLPSSPYEWVEVRFRSDRPGSLRLFWALTTEEPYGGFRQAQMLSAPCPGDGAFHTYRFFPLVRAAQVLIRLRFDPPAGSHFALQSVSVMGEEPGSGATFRVPAGWTSVDATASPLAAAPGSEPEWLIRPVTPFLAGDRPWLVLQGATNAAGKIRFGWLRSDAGGLSESSSTMQTSARNHALNVPLAGNPDWKGTIVALATYHDAEAVLSPAALTPAAEPVGPPDPAIRRLFLWTVAPRAGKDAPDATIAADIENQGGKTASGLTATLQVPPGLTLLSPARATVDDIDTGESRRMRWTVHADRPVAGLLRLKLHSPQGEQESSTAIDIPAMKGAKSTAVPAPRPVPSSYDVGIYYFPGWGDYSRWQVLDEFPERTPTLGYYREGDPAVADWQLKWMAEHAVKFIAYDWYWQQGGRSLVHALENAYFKAPNRRFVKFCLLWANHNAAHSSSAADLEAVTRYWLEHYFRRSEYYTIDGKPVIIIFAPGRFTEDMGVAAVKESFNRMREACKAAGLPGIYLVACVGPDQTQIREAADEGYDATSGYNYPGVNAPPGSLSAPYSTLIPGYEEVWQSIVAEGTLPYIAPTAPGWDNRPWAGDRALVRTGSTPALFRQMLRKARTFADAHPLPTRTGPRKVVLVEAWNEFGEGDYVEPCRGYGFGMLDAVREVFAAPGTQRAHVDLVPADLGMGPYELQPLRTATAWNFAGAADTLGWSAQNMTDPHATAAGLKATATNGDPAFIGSAMDARAAVYSKVEITLSVDAGEDGQLFWATKASPFAETQSLHFAIIPDGKPHTYVINVAKNSTWTGRITQLRIDPSTIAGSHAALLGVRLLP